MNSRNELLGAQIEASQQYKKKKILADALAGHIITMLSKADYSEMDVVDLQLAAQGMAEVIAEMRSIAERLDKINKSLGCSRGLGA